MNHVANLLCGGFLLLLALLAIGQGLWENAAGDYLPGRIMLAIGAILLVGGLIVLSMPSSRSPADEARYQEEVEALTVYRRQRRQEAAEKAKERLAKQAAVKARKLTTQRTKASQAIH